MTMGKIEQRLFDLEEYLRRNDDSADSSAYLTIVGIANDVSELESENAKLRELVKAMKPFLCCMPFASCNTLAANVRDRMRELRIEATDA